MLTHLKFPHRPRPMRFAWGLALGILLLAAPVALAGWMSLNTDDGSVTANIGPAFYTSNCTNGNLADYLEIKNAWAVKDGAGFYFRLEACAQPTGNEAKTLRIGAGIDCNNDGDIADPYVVGPEGDRKVVYWPAADQVWVYSGTNQPVVQMEDISYGERVGATYEWWTPLEYLAAACRASDQEVGLALATVKIAGLPVTQDETPLTPWSHPIDYGDANNPDPLADPPSCSFYPTRLGCDGARHGALSALNLGALKDAEAGADYAVNADADDTTGLADEDGVAPTEGTNWSAGAQGSIAVTISGGSGYLNCWIDWNNDNDWADAGERVVADAAVAAGLNTRTFSVPGSVTYPASFVSRCRLTPGAGQATTVTGAAEFGEVEDHKWAFGATGNRPATPTLSGAVSGADVALNWTENAANEGYLVLTAGRPYFAAGDGDVTTVSDNASPHLDSGKVGGAPDTLYYAVQGQVTTSTPDLVSALSNRVALFEYALTPGSP